MIDKIKAEIERLEKHSFVDPYIVGMKDGFKHSLKWAEELEKELKEELAVTDISENEDVVDMRNYEIIEKAFHGEESEGE
jgi:hypothetical protein